MAQDPDGQRRGPSFPLPDDRPAAASPGGLDRQPFFELGQACDRPSRWRCLRRSSKTTILSITRSFSYALALRQCARQCALPRHRRYAHAGPSCSRTVAPMRGTTTRRLQRAAQQDRAARPRRHRRTNAQICIWFLLLSEALAYMTGQAINYHRRPRHLVMRGGSTMKKTAGHPSRRPRPSRGPYELDDGRVIYANTYKSEIGVLGPQDQQAGHSTPMSAAGRMPACSAPTARSIRPRTPNVGAWVAPESIGRPRFRRRCANGKVEILVTEADGKKFDGPNDLTFAPDGRLWFTDSGDWNQADKATSRPHHLHREERRRQDRRGTRLHLSQRHRRRARWLDRLGRSPTRSTLSAGLRTARRP